MRLELLRKKERKYQQWWIKSNRILLFVQRQLNHSMQMGPVVWGTILFYVVQSPSAMELRCLEKSESKNHTDFLVVNVAFEKWDMLWARIFKIWIVGLSFINQSLMGPICKHHSKFINYIFMGIERSLQECL